MSRRRSNRVTVAPRPAGFVFLCLQGLLLGGCNSGDTSPLSVYPRGAEDMPDATRYRPGENEFSVMTYNLFRYSMEDRDKDGVPCEVLMAEKYRA